MTNVLLATDADWLAEEVFAAVAGDGTVVSRVNKGSDVRQAVAQLAPELTILDLQIGNMGGVAASIDLRHEATAGRVPDTKIVLLLDREADVFVAEQAQSDGWLVKPLDPFRLRRGVAAVLAGEAWREGVPAEPESSADDEPVENAETAAPEDADEPVENEDTDTAD